MKKASKLLIITLLLLSFALVLNNCGGGGGDDSGSNGSGCDNCPTLIDDAMVALESQDFTDANSKFRTAYETDSADNDANFGLALTDTLLLLENQDVIDIVEGWEESVPLIEDILDGDLEDNPAIADIALLNNMVQEGLKKKVKSISQKLPKEKTSFLDKVKNVANIVPSSAPSISEIQQVIEDTIYPVIESAISKLRAIEGKGYTFTVTPAMTDYAEVEDTILDDGEFYILDAALCTLKSVMEVVTAYHLDVDYDSIEYHPLGVLDNDVFFTLKTDGASKMNKALLSLREAADQAEKAYNFIKSNDTDISTDNGIDFEDLTSEDHENIQDIIDATQMALAGQVTFGIDISGGFASITLSDNAITLTHIEEVEESDRSFSKRVNLVQAFTNPLDRSDLPSLRYDFSHDQSRAQQEGEPVCTKGGESVECQIVPSSNLPDWTFNGIFPDGLPHYRTFETIDGLMYLENALLLEQNSDGSVYPGTLTPDGTHLFTYVEDYSVYPTHREILMTNSSDGSIADTYTTLAELNWPYQNGDIVWIDDLTYHNGNVWATGRYSDGTSNYQEGVFSIDRITGKASSVIPYTMPGWLDGLTSDGTNLYAGIQNEICNPDCIEGGGIVAFQHNATAVPNNYLIELGWADNIVFGDGHLWMDGIKINASSGTVVNNYFLGEGEVNAYLNGKIYTVDSDRIHVFTAP